MSWEIPVQEEFEREILDPIVQDAVDMATENETNGKLDIDELDRVLSDNIHDVLDGRFIYYADQLAAILYYGHVNDGFDATWEDLYSDVYDRARNEYLDYDAN